MFIRCYLDPIVLSEHRETKTSVFILYISSVIFNNKDIKLTDDVTVHSNVTVVSHGTVMSQWCHSDVTVMSQLCHSYVTVCQIKHDRFDCIWGFWWINSFEEGQRILAGIVKLKFHWAEVSDISCQLNSGSLHWDGPPHGDWVTHCIQNLFPIITGRMATSGTTTANVSYSKTFFLVNSVYTLCRSPHSPRLILCVWHSRPLNPPLDSDWTLLTLL